MKLLVLAWVCAAAFFHSAHAADTVEVLHRWTSPGEVAALQVFKNELAQNGIRWTDMAIAGQNPDATTALLRKRVLTNDPPTAAFMFTTDMQAWAKLGALANLDAVAAAEGWDKVVPKALQPSSKVQGHWVAVPLNINGFNRLWASRAALERAGVTEMPATWDAFIVALDKLKRTGLVPFAFSGRTWEIDIVFESIVIATGGPDFHKRVFLDRDKTALGSDTMKQSFDRLTQLRQYADAGYEKRSWPDSAALLNQDKAGFQIMGDWVKGEFLAAGKVAGRDFLCGPSPGTQGTLLYASDQLGMFNLSSGNYRRTGALEVQAKMAAVLMSAKAQSAFNVIKGSLPVRLDVSDGAFDACGKLAIKDLKNVAGSGSMIQPMSLVAPPLMKKAFYEVIEQQFAGKISSAEATKGMVAAVE